MRGGGTPDLSDAELEDRLHVPLVQERRRPGRECGHNRIRRHRRAVSDGACGG